MKKAVVEVAVLAAILGVTASQVRTNQPTTNLSATEKRMEATRLGNKSKAKWTSKLRVAGVPLQANHPAVQTNAATQIKVI